MKHRQGQRVEYEAGTTRTPSLLQRMWGAAAFARRWVHRKGVARIPTAPAIEDQLRALRPVCSAQRCRPAPHAGSRRWRWQKYTPSTDVTRWG